jgi:ketosteroid isomerase-like protein
MRTRSAGLPLAALPLLVLLVACARKDDDVGADSGAVAPPAAGATSEATLDTRADEDSIRAISKRWVQLVAARDTAAIGALFAEDGVEFAPNAPAAKGPGAVAKSWGGLYRIGKDVTLAFEPSDVAVAQAGDMAVERGTYQTSWVDAKGKAMKDHGNYVTAWRKVNGRWQVVADINASEVPMPGM